MGIDEIVKNICKVRKYKQASVKYKDARKIAEAANQTLLLDHIQPPLVVIITSQEDKFALKSIAEKNHVAENLDCLTTASYILLIFADINSEMWRESAWIAIATMVAAARAAASA